MEISQTIFVCEGYHDRSFLAGWLLRIGCVDLSQTLGRRVKDPWGKPVVLGHYGYNDVRGRFLRIAPAGGESQCFAVADGLLSGRSTQPIRDLFLVVDADASAATREEQFKGLVQRHEGTLTHPRLAVLSPHTQLHLLVLETQTDPEVSCLVSYGWTLSSKLVSSRFCREMALGRLCGQRFQETPDRRSDVGGNRGSGRRVSCTSFSS